MKLVFIDTFFIVSPGINRFMFFKSIFPRRGLKELSVSRNSYFIEMLFS